MRLRRRQLIGRSDEVEQGRARKHQKDRFVEPYSCVEHSCFCDVMSMTDTDARWPLTTRCGHTRVWTGDDWEISGLAPPTVAPATYSQRLGANELWLKPNRCAPEPVAKGDLGEMPEFHMQIALFIPRRIPTVSPSFIERNQLASMKNPRSQFVHVVSPTLQAVPWRIGLEEVPELRRRP